MTRNTMTSLSNIRTIQSCFNKVLLYSQDLEGTLETDALFDLWKTNKARFYKAWDNQLIYKYPKPVTFTISDRERKQRIAEFIDHVYDDLSCNLGDFLSKNQDGIMTNSLINTHYTGYEEDREWNFANGLKLSKAIGQLAKDGYCSHDVAEYARVQIAQLIQENTVSGTLCFSVHPLDYLSLSENQSHWRSCHALDGEYRSGNLSYMVDPYTIVAYLQSENDTMELPRFPGDVRWNNKKWRCLFFFDYNHQIVWAGRQYPFYNKSVLMMIGDWLSNMSHKWKYFDVNYDNDYYWSIGNFRSDTFRKMWKRRDEMTDDRAYEFEKVMLYYSGNMCQVEDLVENAPDSMQYNDLISSSTYTPDFLVYNPYHDLRWMLRQPKMAVGGAAPCIWCGEDPIGYSDIMVCPDCLKHSDLECDYICTCERCGKRMLFDEQWHLNDMTLCEDCYRDLTD